MTYASCRACRDCSRLGNAAVYGRKGRYDAADVRALRGVA